MCPLSPRCAGRCTDVAAPLQENVLRRGSQHYLPWRVRLPRSRVGLTTSPSEEASMLRIRNRAQFARRSYSGKKVRANGDARKHPRPRSVLGYFNSLLESKVGFWVATTVTAALMTSAVSYYQNWSKSGTKDLSSGGIAYVRAASSFISAAMDACAPVSVSPLVVLGCKPVPCTLARGGTIQQQMMIPLACRA